MIAEAMLTEGVDPDTVDRVMERLISGSPQARLAWRAALRAPARPGGAAAERTAKRTTR
jgi:hypothetical protein